MGEPGPTRLDPVLGDVVERLLEGLADSPVDWAFTGSTSFALQGVPVEPNDVDVQTTESGAYEIERRFAGHVAEPVSFQSGKGIRSHFGVLSLDGVTVEIMGAVQKQLADGTWEAPVVVETHRQFVPFRGDQVPVLSLDYEARAYEQLGRTERARLIRDYVE